MSVKVSAVNDWHNAECNWRAPNRSVQSYQRNKIQWRASTDNSRKWSSPEDWWGKKRVDYNLGGTHVVSVIWAVIMEKGILCQNLRQVSRYSGLFSHISPLLVLTTAKPNKKPRGHGDQEKYSWEVRPSGCRLGQKKCTEQIWREQRCHFIINFPFCKLGITIISSSHKWLNKIMGAKHLTWRSAHC